MENSKPITHDTFVLAYIEAALWSTTFSDNDRTFSDEGYSILDFDRSTMRRMIDDCDKFQRDNADMLARAYDLYPRRGWSQEAQAGHDFWLTREGHGAGFWDRGIGDVGAALTQASEAFGPFELYLGDDGKIHA